MTTEHALLEAIARDPASDAPRLVYADWLSAQGDPRGEFIVLQCRLAAAPDDEARRKLRIAENRLLGQHGGEWSAPVRDLTGADPVFRRGFVDEASLPLAQLGMLGPLLEAAPLLRHLRVDAVHFDCPAKELASLRSVPALAQLESLDLRARISVAAAEVLGGCEHLRGLRQLRFTSTLVRDDTQTAGPSAQESSDAAGVLARSPVLSGLRDLDLHGWMLLGSGVQALLEAPWPLDTLDLSYCFYVTAREGAAALASSTRPPTLRVLGLAGIQPDEQGCAALSQAPCLAGLESLDLERGQFGIPRATAFFAEPRLPALTRLRLERNALFDRGLAALLASPLAAQLRVLDLGHNRIGKKGVAALASTPALSKLERLYLNEPGFGDEVRDLLAGSPTLATTEIWLQGRKLRRG